MIHAEGLDDGDDTRFVVSREAKDLTDEELAHYLKLTLESDHVAHELIVEEIKTRAK